MAGAYLAVYQFLGVSDGDIIPDGARERGLAADCLKAGGGA
jgi:hypothetical protein